MNFKVIYEDPDILVCFKPAGVATQTASLQSQDMVSLLKNYLVREGSGEDPYLGLIHRLDQPVSGLLVFARNKQAASHLCSQMQRKSHTDKQAGGKGAGPPTAYGLEEPLDKEYLALCMGYPGAAEGSLTHWISKDPVTKLARVEKEPDKEGKSKKAVLSYQVIRQEEGASLVRINLQTGRFHQIRAQFAFMGNPLLGDGKYGDEASKALSARKGIDSIALCAHRLGFIHPRTGETMEFELEEKDYPAWLKNKNKCMRMEG